LGAGFSQEIKRFALQSVNQVPFNAAGDPHPAALVDWNALRIHIPIQPEHRAARVMILAKRDVFWMRWFAFLEDAQDRQGLCAGRMRACSSSGGARKSGLPSVHPA